MSEHAVTVLISRQVKAGCEADFERVTQALMRVAERARGCLGAQLVRPGEDPEVADQLYHVVLAFDCQHRLDAWQASPERAQGMAATAPFIEGPFRMRPMQGLGLWFRTAMPVPPPRWKVAAVSWLGICPTVYLVFLALGDRWQAWPLLPRTVLLTAIVVVAMTWLVAPQLTRWLRPWLAAQPGRS